MNLKNLKRYFTDRTWFSVVLLGTVFFGLGIYVGLNNIPEIKKVGNKVSGKETMVDTVVDFSPFWKTWNNLERHPAARELGDEKKLYGAISGLVDSLGDPYSDFYDPRETKIFEEDIGGNFSGVGMEIGIKERVLTVIAPLKGTPAARAGIRSGDRILKIDEESTAGMSIEEAIMLIRGEPGTKVKLSILEEDASEPKEILITRENIEVPALESELRPDGIFLIELHSFSANSADLFRRALRDFSLSGSERLLLDLRGNPGGYLDAAVDMASWFIEGGKAVVIEDYGGNKKQKIYRSRGYDIFGDNLKMVVLIDKGSASAAEILAGALRDHGKAVLVGERSYGKGSIQETVRITPHTLLKITTARWLTPEGTSISEKGLEPDYEVPAGKKQNSESDPQMDKAKEILNN